MLMMPNWYAIHVYQDNRPYLVPGEGHTPLPSPRPYTASAGSTRSSRAYSLACTPTRPTEGVSSLLHSRPIIPSS